MRLKIIFIFLLQLWFCHILRSQTYKEYVDKGNAVQMTNLDSSIHYFKMAEVVSTEKKDTAKIIFATSVLGQLYRMNGAFDSSISYNRKALSLANNPTDKAKSLVNLAVALDVESNKEVDSLYYEAEIIADELKENGSAGFVVLQLAVSYIEGNQQFREGESSENKSKKFFIKP